MEEPKKLVYDSGAQPEEVFLRVSGYLDRNRLYVGIYQTEYGYPELFSDVVFYLSLCDLFFGFCFGASAIWMPWLSINSLVPCGSYSASFFRSKATF